MSRETVTSFFREIPRNPALQGRLRKISTDDPEGTLLEVISAAQAEGYSFSLEDLQFALKGEGELGEDDLKVVLGGRGGLGPLHTWIGVCKQ